MTEPSSSSGTDAETDDSDGDDDDVTQKVRGLKYSTCLQPCDPEYAASELSMAPAEGQTPLDIMMDVNAELLAFPSKFPLGRGGMTDDRQVKLTPRKYFVQRLVNKDKRFASDVNYLFFGQFVTEQKQICDNISVAMRQTTGRVSAGDVSDAEQVRQLIQRNNAYSFLQNVRGSPAYFQRAVKELIAMIAQLGCPHFFLTLSAADMSWPELFRIISQCNTGQSLSDAEINSMTYEQKASMIRTDPVVAARHFDYRLQAFFKHMLKHASILGKMQYFFYRIEFQMRGSPHCHVILWCSDGPDMNTASDDEILNFFNDKITGSLPDDDEDLLALVNRVQRHSHSVACKKNKTGSCRF